jgi:hypothetical protein
LPSGALDADNDETGQLAKDVAVVTAVSEALL